MLARRRLHGASLKPMLSSSVVDASYVSRRSSSVSVALLLNCRGGDFKRREDDDGREDAHT